MPPPIHAPGAKRVFSASWVRNGPNTKVRTLKIFPNVIHDKTFVYPKDCFQCLFGLKRLKWLPHANLLWAEDDVWHRRFEGLEMAAIEFWMLYTLPGFLEWSKSWSHRRTRQHHLQVLKGYAMFMTGHFISCGSWVCNDFRVWKMILTKVTWAGK